MKNVLFVLPFFPYPLISGGHQAIFNGINAVCEDVNAFITYCEYPEYPMLKEKSEFAVLTNNRVSLMPYILPAAPRGRRLLSFIYRIKFKIKQCLGEKTISNQDRDFEEWKNQLFNINGGYLEHINEIITKCKIDIVQCEMLEMASVVYTIPSHVRSIFVEHEIGFVRKKLRLVDKGDNSLLSQVQLNMNKVMEVGLLNHYDTVITLSKIDSEKLIEAGVKSQIYSSFAIVNTPANLDSAYSEGSYVLSFVGPELHPSNKSGLMWFLSNCWERLNSKHKFSLIVIGIWDDMTKKSIESQYPGVSFLGYVKNLREAISNTTMIVPITVGSGIRMKILEACAIGVPVVTTSVGCEGLPLVSGKDCMISDSAEDFVDSIISLQNLDFRNNIICSAKSAISSKYSLAALRDNRAGLYK